MNSLVPVAVLSGFLGTRKATLLNPGARPLRSERGRVPLPTVFDAGLSTSMTHSDGRPGCRRVSASTRQRRTRCLLQELASPPHQRPGVIT